MHCSSIRLTLHCSHDLKDILKPDDPCSRLHGHSYGISLEIAYFNVADKLVAHFGLIKNQLKNRYDHRHLNDVMKTPPTAENLAKDIYDFLVHLRKGGALGDGVQINHVTVSETENNTTTYIPEEEEPNGN